MSTAAPAQLGMLDRLEVGREYVAVGPAPGEKWEPQRCRIDSIDEAAGLYRTSGLRQAAPVIMFGCERFWRPAEGASDA
jgi:hypothetical protein